MGMGCFMRILIAEDDLISRKIMKKYLTQFGDCDIAVDGVEAVDSFLLAYKENKPYEFICLDIMMPKIDGIRALKVIRDIEKQKGIDGDKRVKIIMTTALNDKDTVQKAYDSGCQGYASKPVDLVKFEEAMKTLGIIE